jgi:hypothetical protein
MSLTVAVALLGLLTVAFAASTIRAQDYYNGNYNYNGNALGTFNSNYAFGPAYGYGPYGAETLAPYASGYAYQPNAYPYYGNYYYGAYPAYGYVYGGPILYGRFGRGGRVGYRFGWW